jgi:hypothetical protein
MESTVGKQFLNPHTFDSVLYYCGQIVEIGGKTSKTSTKDRASLGKSSRQEFTPELDWSFLKKNIRSKK